MLTTPPNFEVWNNPSPNEVGKDYLEFVRILKAPTWITIDGDDPTRNRAIVTLLHGNEPSGLKAVHRIIASGKKPATNLGIFVASVNAALLEPPFSHRFLPEESDLNRCFNPPFATDQERLASEILNALKAFKPEAVVDTHNTSAHSEPFAVATTDQVRTLQLSQDFTHRLVVLDLTLGTLIEQHEALNCPIVTIEFGGFMDPRSDEMAHATIEHFVSRKNLFDNEVQPLMLLRHPHRLEVKKGCELHYSSSVQENADITIFNTIDQLNFSRVEKGTALGWIDVNGLNHLHVLSAGGEDILQDYLSERDGFLITEQAVTIFMATTDAFIARKDCLLYLTPAD